MARARVRWIDWEDRLASSIRKSAGSLVLDPRPRLAAGIILAAIRSTLETVDQPVTDAGLEAALATAFSFVDPSLEILGDPG